MTTPNVNFDPADATVGTDQSIDRVPVEDIYSIEPDYVQFNGYQAPIEEVHTAVNEALEELGLIE